MDRELKPLKDKWLLTSVTEQFFIRGIMTILPDPVPVKIHASIALIPGFVIMRRVILQRSMFWLMLWRRITGAEAFNVILWLGNEEYVRLLRNSYGQATLYVTALFSGLTFVSEI